jgi:hypothetical protein
MRLSLCQARQARRLRGRVVGNLQQCLSTKESDLRWCSMKLEGTETTHDGATHSAVADNAQLRWNAPAEA